MPLGGPVDVQHVQFAVLHDLDAQVEERLDGGVAGVEVPGAGAEHEDLQVLQSQQDPGDGDELLHHGRHVIGEAHRVLGQVGADGAQSHVVRGAQQAAVGVAAAVDEILAALLGGSEIG